MGMKYSVTNKEITVQVGVNNNGNCGNLRCISENGPTPSDEKILKIDQISKLNKSDTTIILGQRSTSSKRFNYRVELRKILRPYISRSQVSFLHISRK